MSFDKRARYYQSDESIGKTRYLVAGKYLRLANVGAIYDFARIIAICRTARRFDPRTDRLGNEYLWFATGDIANSFWFTVR